MKKEKILNLMKTKGIKPTFQRVEVLSYLVENRNHPSVDVIFNDLAKKIPTLSLTTIYNALKLLCKKKIISEILIEENEVRYDYSEKPHIHFKCRKCQKIYDVFKNCSVVKSKEIDGHKIEEYHIYLIGICKECLSREKK